MVVFVDLQAVESVFVMLNLPPFEIRAARVDDVPVLLRLIVELAEYERLANQVTATEPLLREAIFGPKPAAEAVLAIRDGEAVGFALFFSNFSTFLGKPGMYLEDLYVRPEARKQGVGRALFLHVARLAHQRGCGRFEWTALDWNEPARSFYRKHGAQSLDDWTIFRLTADELARLVGAS
jgi:GNAT superfamily N-acetyltransferase